MSRRRGEVDVAELVDRARKSDRTAVARLISLIEDDFSKSREIAERLTSGGEPAHVVGITGPPGVGKSTFTAALVTELRRGGCRVGVLAVDPSSPFSGGALLGDRVRMQEHATDPDVFVRSMATRGHLGGLAAAAPQTVRVIEAAGYDVVLIETVGVGQSEVEVARLADTTVVLLAPGMGDGIQAAKAGVLEIADVFVVNKADRDGAEQVARDLRNLALSGRLSVPSASSAGSGQTGGGAGDDRWVAPILKTTASRGDGIPALSEALAGHRAWLTRTGTLLRRRQDRAQAEIEAIATAAVQRGFLAVRGATALPKLAGLVSRGELDPYAASDTLIASLS